MRRWVPTLIAANVAIYVLQQMQPWVTGAFMWVPAQGWSHPWTAITYMFLHDPSGIGHILFNMLGLYCFGMPLEERYGRREFLRYYLVAVVLGMFVWSAVHYFYLTQNLSPADASVAVQRITCYGASGGVTAVTLLFCLLYPRATLLAAFLFPVPAWLVGIFIIVSNLFGASGSSPLMVASPTMSTSSALD